MMESFVQQRAVLHLGKLLTFNTSNPPGREEEAARYVADVARCAGCEVSVVSLEKGRPNVIVRLRGTGEKGALLLNAHLDVVPPGNELLWRHPPFMAHEEDGWVWGRGAVDMKHMAAMMLAVLEETVARKGVLRSDLVFAWTVDEERGGRAGARFLVENHAPLVRADFGIGEVGGFPVRLGGGTFVPVQAAEKGVAWFRMKAKGPSGHGSTPQPASSVLRLAKAVEKLGAARLPVHLTRTTEAFLKRIVRELVPEPMVELGEIVLSPSLVGALAKLLPNTTALRGLWPMLANTAVPTMLQAGEAPNVVPEEAVAIVDGRILPGQTTSDLLSEVRSIVGSEMELEVFEEAGPMEVSYETELFRVIEETVRRHQPAARVVPFLNPGFTDGKWFSQLGLVWYGFTPLMDDGGRRFDVLELIHAVNERVPLEAVRGGARVLRDLVSAWTGSGG